ncbi:MAG TPA: GNAT family protein [Gaiellaceae bacterium]|nr:GNAT family protein [Gaiellaceae bacterium]
MSASFRRVRADDAQALLDLLHGDPWEMFALPPPDPAELRRQLDAGAYVGEDDQAWWIEERGAAVGLLRLLDLGPADGDPQLAIRLLPAARGRGLGRESVAFATERVFALPGRNRFEAQTRVDNTPMRRTLVSVGWVLEACYRRAWPTAAGTRVDSVGYAILRTDWERGTPTLIDWAGLRAGDG